MLDLDIRLLSAEMLQGESVAAWEEVASWLSATSTATKPNELFLLSFKKHVMEVKLLQLPEPVLKRGLSSLKEKLFILTF